MAEEAPPAEETQPTPEPAPAAEESAGAAAEEVPNIEVSPAPGSQGGSGRSSPANAAPSPTPSDASSHSGRASPASGHGSGGRRGRRRRQSYFQTGGLRRAAPAPMQVVPEPASETPAEEAPEVHEEPPAQMDTWDSVTQQPTCVLCHQVFTSVGKLKQHQQYSTLHESNLRKLEEAKARAQRGESEAAHDDSGGAAEEEQGNNSRLVYQGSKFFWRTSERVDVHIYEEDGPHTSAQTHQPEVIITVIPYNTTTEQEYPYIFVGADKVEACLDQEAINTVCDGDRKYFTSKEREAIKAANRRNALVTFLLARLELADEGDQRLCRLVKLTGDEYDTLEVTPPPGFRTEKIRRRRRSSIAEFRRASVQLDEERKALHEATSRAERLAMLTRMSMNAFMDSMRKTQEESHHSALTKKWKSSVRRTIMRRHVERTREVLANLTGYEADLSVTHTGPLAPGTVNASEHADAALAAAAATS